MKLGLHQSARLEQRLIQSPQMIQAMQILQLPALDLAERIEQELVENPFLEVVERDGDGDGDAPEGPEGSAGPGSGPDGDLDGGPAGEREGEGEAALGEARVGEREGSGDPEAEAGRDGLDSMLEVLERYERDFGDGRAPRSVAGEDGDRKYEAMQNTPAAPKSLPEALLDQVAFLGLGGDRRALLEYLMWSLDERGYLTTSREALAGELSRELSRAVDIDEVAAALDDLRRVTHPALGACDLREALLLQLDAAGRDEPLVRAIVADHLDDLEANRLPRIAKACGRSIEDVKAALEQIRALDPSPAADYGEVTGALIYPEVVVAEVDGQYLVRLERERQPELTISRAYRQLLQQARQGDGVRDWIKKRLESARWFIDAVQQRQSTLRRIAESIFRRQRDFLDRGVSALHPLRMQEVADELGVHISTVSRGVSGKYAQTPRGIFPLKFFFTGGTAKDSGEVASQVSIKERIRELVSQEDPAQPLSDDQLAARLAESDGIRIARRTVTKYRKALDIPSSAQRRVY